MMIPVSHGFAFQYTYENCITYFPSSADWRTLEFASFLDLHFQSKDQNSTLVSDAIDAFVEYKKAIWAELDKYKVGTTTPTTSQLSSIDSCVLIAEKKIDEAKTMLRKHVMTTGRIKQQTILLDKYKAINNKLRDLNMTIAKMVGAFETFKNKLPGYLKSCVKQ